MKAIRKILDNMKPHVQKGGKFHMFHSAFDAVETLFFVPDHVTTKGSHIRDAVDMKRTMIWVVIALIPALLFGMWNVGRLHFLSHGEAADFWQMFGYGFWKVLPIIIVTYATGLGLEIIFAQKRGHEVNEGFFVSGMLIPLLLPPDIPLWMVAVATAFAVVIGKEVFGGTGMNILNPALTARAFLFFAYPSDMSGDKVWISDKADAFSGATPLGDALVDNIGSLPSPMEMFIGTIPGSIGETSTLLIILGGIILLATGVASWRILLSTIAGGMVMGLLFNLWGLNDYMNIPAYYHLIMGGFAFGAVFMATDPVTATQTNKGKYIYGFLIGLLAVLIRVFNPAYPEGMMLAILFMNVFAPLIDHYVIEANIKKRLKRAKA
ncbi:MAG: NADH:ubiquinone reductase (Na(+)-transporting) subunit B [Bacteroidetes bacterium]|nr:NADH:ubiquinone reductase (Na(+)-transporting) subunit B [Bacteroidota bacterium]|tara:strand:- start:56 stop:1192 length:1137 start_codon:yes stop_codon:yes gene_type:complete